MLDISEGFTAVLGIMAIARSFTRAMSKASAGRRRITPEEWGVIQAEIAAWIAKTSADVVD